MSPNFMSRQRVAVATTVTLGSCSATPWTKPNKHIKHFRLSEVLLHHAQPVCVESSLQKGTSRQAEISTDRVFIKLKPSCEVRGRTAWTVSSSVGTPPHAIVVTLPFATPIMECGLMDDILRSRLCATFRPGSRASVPLVCSRKLPGARGRESLKQQKQITRWW